MFEAFLSIEPDSSPSLCLFHEGLLIEEIDFTSIVFDSAERHHNRTSLADSLESIVQRLRTEPLVKR